jgi:hypothetical protein
MRNPLDWTILDVEEGEWNQVIAASDAAAIPASVPQPYSPRPSLRNSPPIPWRQVLFAAAWALVLVAACAFAVWRQAEQGLSDMQGDITIAVKGEALAQRTHFPEQDEHVQVETVEFLDGKAVAQVIVTRTLAFNQLLVRRETRFFAQTPKGWTRIEPLAAFWGEKESLELGHLRFVFRTRDREIARQVAPEVEAFYLALHRILAAPMLASQANSDTALTIELLPERVFGSGRQCWGWIGLTSPFLYKPDTLRTRHDILAAQLRHAMLRYMLSYDKSVSQPRQTWEFLYSGVYLWLMSSDSLPLAPGDATDHVAFALPLLSARLFHLCTADTEVGAKPAGDCVSTEYSRYQGSNHDWNLQVASAFADFVATYYGEDALGALVQGLSSYGDWETLAPATLGVSAAELENTWQTYLAGTQGAVVATHAETHVQAPTQD